MARNPEMGGGRAKSGSLERGVQGIKRDEKRPRNEDRGFQGNDGEPTARSKGLIEKAEDFLAETDAEIRAALGADPFQESFRPDPRPPNDEERPPLRPPSEEEEPAIIPGDPSNLGARGRRRRGQNDSNASPVLRRGLLGV